MTFASYKVCSGWNSFLISFVFIGSPAEKADLEVADEILEVNGESLENSNHTDVIAHIHNVSHCIMNFLESHFSSIWEVSYLISSIINYSKTPILEYYFCCRPKFLLHNSPRFWNNPWFWNTFAADQLVFQNRGFTVSPLFLPFIFNRLLGRKKVVGRRCFIGVEW